MIEENLYICPKCGAIRYNIGQNIDKDTYVEIHMFCRQCEAEFVVKEEKKSRFSIYPTLKHYYSEGTLTN